MAQDNTLGAPTEGLGQTVTFGLGQAGGVPQAQPVHRGVFRMSAQGGATLATQALQVPEAQQNKTFAVLARLAGDTLKPQIAEATQEARMRGYRQAMEGQAVQEIADEQPWYSKLLGDTPVVDGARAYTAAAKASQLAADIEGNMADLRKLDGPEFDKHLTGLVKGATTGDTATDLLIQQQVEQVLPASVKAWKKNNILYKQGLFDDSLVGSVQAASSQLAAVDRAAREGGSATEQPDVLEAALPLLNAVVNPGIDAAHHDKLVAKALTADLAAGNFTAYNVLAIGGKFAKLTPEARASVEYAYRKASAEAKMTMPQEFLMKVAEFETQARNPETQNPEAILKAAAELNAEATRITGDTTPYIGPATTVRELVQYKEVQWQRLDAARREADRAQGQASKKAAEEAWVTSTAAAVINPSVAYSMAHLKPAEQEDVFNRIRVTKPEAVLTAAALQWPYKVIDKVTQNAVQAGVKTAMISGDAAMMAQVYKTAIAPLIQAGGGMGDAIASTYAGDMGEFVSRYHNLVKGQPESAVAYQTAFVQAANPMPAVKDSKFVASIAAELKSNSVVGLVKNVLGTDSVPILDPEGLARRLAPGVSQELPLDQAIEKAKRDNPHLGIAGGYYWSKNPGDTNLRDWVLRVRNVNWANKDNVDRVFNKAVEHFASAVNLVGTPAITQIQDAAGGVPTFYVGGQTAGGTTRFNVFTAADMNLWLDKQAEQAAVPKTLPSAQPVPMGGQRNQQDGFKGLLR